MALPVPVNLSQGDRGSGSDAGCNAEQTGGGYCG